MDLAGLPRTERRAKLAELHLDPTNARRHPVRNLGVVRSSLTEFGQVERLVVQKASGRIIGGNGRYEVLRSMGVLEVDVTEIDCDDLTAARLGIVLNRSAELAEWDDAALNAHLAQFTAQGSPIEGLGFSQKEADELAAAVAKAAEGPIPPSEFGEVDPNAPAQYQCPKCSYSWSGKPNPAAGA